MSMSEEELAVEIGEIDSVKIYDVNVAESSSDQILQQLASNTAGAYDQNARLQKGLVYGEICSCDMFHLPHGSGCRESRETASNTDRVA